MSDEIRKYTVHPAEPYQHSNMGSFGKADHMLIRQHNFPHEYYSDEKMHSAYHDRMLSWDYDGFINACRTHFNSGDGGIQHFAENASPESIFAFLKEVFKADTSVEWTGFRVTGTVNRSNGYPVYTLELFAKDPARDTQVYSSENAPNVKGFPEDEEIVNGWGGGYGRYIRRRRA